MSKQRQIALVGIIASLLIGALVAAAGSQGSVEVGSVPVFALAALLAFAINLVAFVPSYLAGTERFYDLTGSITYITVTLVALATSDDLDARAVVAGLLVMAWAGRLGTFLFRRVSRDGGDGRFDAIKTDPLRFAMAWSLQGLWVLFTASAALAAITAEERVDTDAWLVIGVLVWLIGFGIEVVADTQKSAFRADPANRGRFITSGLWAWSRHPNYFGEITLWVGMAILAVPVLSGSRWVVLISPVFVFVLLTRISGIPLLERRARKRWGDDPDWVAYTDSTPALVPRPPRR